MVPVGLFSLTVGLEPTMEPAPPVSLMLALLVCPWLLPPDEALFGLPAPTPPLPPLLFLLEL